MFNKILIANRGEIACRIIRSANKMGIKTVAVYSEADASARHVDLADEAIEIGPAPARQSYLVIEAIIDAAIRSGAEAIHPGYGFLSENAEFAEACEKNKIVFIGPPVEAIMAMGSKSQAKQIMGDASVPLVPGYHGEDQSEALLLSEANKIGYPVLIKASAGGGGKGMRIVNQEAEFSEGLAAAKREALSSFSDDKVLIEKYLTKPRHIEIQVFCDQAGNAVYLFERDCSIQRRHQKVLEEAPAPGMQVERREEMGKAAIAAAQAINYVGAGTVEFIVDEDGSFYFMEMNTRLQVEHPVTELITGQDLVEWQVLVAFGDKLPSTQNDLTINGHALEARIYAEDPDRDFLPATGLLSHLRFPQDNQHVRVDTGVREGDSVSVHYDPMIAKLIVWDRDRASCLRRMSRALDDTQVVGVTTNIDFLSSLVSHPAFEAAQLDTGFIEEHHEQLFLDSHELNDNILALATLYILLDRSDRSKINANNSADSFSPWHSTNAWQANIETIEDVYFLANGTEHLVQIHYKNQSIELLIDKLRISVSGTLNNNGELDAHLDGTRTHVTVVKDGDSLTILHSDYQYTLTALDKTSQNTFEESAPGSLISPMPGKVIDVLVTEGDKVAAGAPLLILEAMKMEHTICAPLDGTVKTIHYKAGDMLDEGVELLVVEE
ncbi:MAG: acetyl-CoA carboxylase biotin carboxylase subunit [Gammaproteobacteria bacterium]|nr:acetyl-CoA carboxylase biotin carboxylase subunit [Gammaproteobacteria bacterium]